MFKQYKLNYKQLLLTASFKKYFLRWEQFGFINAFTD